MVRHSFSDLRPTIADPTIWIPKSTKDGILTIQVDPASYSKMVRYKVYIQNESSEFHNSTACGVVHG